MDLADASIVTAAEILNIRTVFTLDHRDFSATVSVAGTGTRRSRS